MRYCSEGGREWSASWAWFSSGVVRRQPSAGQEKGAFLCLAHSVTRTTGFFLFFCFILFLFFLGFPRSSYSSSSISQSSLFTELPASTVKTSDLFPCSGCSSVPRPEFAASCGRASSAASGTDANWYAFGIKDVLAHR